MIDQAMERQLESAEAASGASQLKMIVRRLRRHRLGMFGLVMIAIFYTIAIFADTIAPYDPLQRFSTAIHRPPQRIHFVDAEGNFSWRPFVYGGKSQLDMETFQRVYVEDTSKKHYIRFFVRGYPYKLFGLFPTDIHLFGVDEGGTLFLFGTDQLGRDMFSRIIHGARISLSIGLVGVLISLVIGVLVGGISGYFGGVVDEVTQRVIETLRSIPQIPLWLGLSAALPPDWSPLKVYFAITIILSLLGWTYVARVTRSKFIALREEDFIVAARAIGCTTIRVILRHLIPEFASYIIVAATLAIPGMILGETALSFLGIGLRPPVVSWGVLLQQAQNIAAVNTYPWLMLPAPFVILAVLAFNFVGDALRDAIDPYSQ